MKEFRDCFWEADFCSTVGFDTVLKRAKDGYQVGKDFLEFVKQRAQLEEAHGKALVKLAKCSLGQNEFGSHRIALDSLKAETENIGYAHNEVAAKFFEEQAKISVFLEDQRNKRKQVEETVKKYQIAKKNHHKKTVDLKKSYENKCREADAAELDYEVKKDIMLQKDKEKLFQKKDKLITAAGLADKAYQDAVTILEQTRIHWEEETEIALETLQILETERIRFLRNSCWVHVNISSANCVRVDELHEEVRKTLENCDPEHDVQLFINQHQTGNIRPSRIEYHNYYDRASRGQRDNTQSSFTPYSSLGNDSFGGNVYESAYTSVGQEVSRRINGKSRTLR